ncbi:hypothetical protein K435DRAFT_715660 [Dendrothele bispora CBS 962.96]|uniref:Uncharacterized protein n=1 Tax=Dendrothele bispora (strain CBS 962.96) TaxID=1314807 RepID=A0A4S8MKG6_DENBC|nr:hypothetical protein K435DRAFT_715660 [Dendrothele bispora CBS 962.96]
MSLPTRLALTSLRTARQCLPKYSSCTRTFITTHRRQSEGQTDHEELQRKYAQLQNSELFKKLQASPSALDAASELGKIMQKEGFDFTSGKKPSAMQMMKLAFNSEIKEASLRLKEELDKAGIDITDKNLVAEMMNLLNVPSPKKD